MAGPHPDVAAARTAVRRALADLTPGARVLVACSGGPDSLALAAATAFVAPRAGWAAGAVVVDHGLQAGSAATAARAARQCRDLGLSPVTVARVTVPAAGGPEGAAREARYAALDDAARAAGADAVLLGHTLDDQAETVLLGLARGSGARSLAGMAPVRGLWRRPFLGLRRAQTQAVCRALDLDAHVDPTNTADGPWRAADGTPLRRAAVREQALPALAEALGPGVVPALARTAGQLRRDADLLDAQAAELLAAAQAGHATPDDAVPDTDARHTAAPGVSTDTPRVVLDVAVLSAAHPALRTRALRAAALAAGAAPGALAAVHVDAMDALVVDHHGQGPLQVPGGVEVVRECGRLILAGGRAAGTRGAAPRT